MELNEEEQVIDFTKHHQRGGVLQGIALACALCQRVHLDMCHAPLTFDMMCQFECLSC